MSEFSKMLTAAIGAGILLGATATQAQQPSLKMTLFGQPSVNNDSIWMALEKGYYQQEGLDVTYRLFPSGTTAFQSFQTGQGDIVITGDLPSVQYFFRVKGDYRTIAVVERDAKGYVAVARKEITKPQDLLGKTVATRVGSTGSWFIPEYLTKNGVDPSKVAALCGATEVRKATADEVRAATGYAIGGTPPLGHDRSLRCFVDEDLMGFEEVWAAAGTPDGVFPLTPAELVRASRGSVAAFAETPPAG